MEIKKMDLVQIGHQLIECDLKLFLLDKTLNYITIIIVEPETFVCSTIQIKSQF